MLVSGEVTNLLSVDYDSAGRDIGHDYGNGTEVDFTLRDAGLRAGIRHTFNSGSLEFSMTYDASGRVTGKSNSRHPELGETYHYDGADRLDEFHRSGSQSGLIRNQTFDLDKLGNWTETTFDGKTESRTHNALNQITAREGDLLEGLSETVTPTWDEAGNLHSDGFRTCVWDANNRLVSCVVSSDSPVGKPGEYHYKYDALGRRISDGERIFLYDGWRVIEERLVDTSTSTVNYPLEKTYIWGPRYLDELVSVDVSVTRVYDPSTSGWVDPDSGNAIFVWDSMSDTGIFTQRFFVHQDNIFNVAAVTDMSGSVVLEYAYDFTGRRKIIFDSNDASPAYPHTLTDLAYGNTGQRHDAATGLMYWKNRYYSVEFGRFISRDPLGYVDGMSLYRLYGWMDAVGLATKCCGKITTYDDVRECCYKNNEVLTKVRDGGGKICCIRDLVPIQVRIEDGVVGHTWIHIPASSNGGTAFSRGFYPIEEMFGSQGEVELEGANRKYDSSITYYVCPSTVSDLISNIRASAANPPVYNLDTYNCTHWALARINDVGLTIPSGMDSPAELDDASDSFHAPIPVALAADTTEIINSIELLQEAERARNDAPSWADPVERIPGSALQAGSTVVGTFSTAWDYWFGD